MSEGDRILRILHHQQLALITNVIEVTHICGIPSIIIGHDSIRGIDRNQRVFICNKATDIDLPFNRLTVNRVDALKRKFDIAADMADLVVNVVVVKEDAVQKIVFTGQRNGTRTMFDHRCDLPAQPKVPGSVNDNCTTAIKLPKGIYRFLVQAAKTSQHPEEVRIKSDQDGVSLELQEAIGDVLRHQLREQPGPKFYNCYSLRVFKALLKVSPEETTWLLGNKGVIKTNITGLDVFVLPKA